MIVDIDHLNSKNDRIFFGEYSGFQRFDNPSYPAAVKLEESMRGAFWNPNEITMKDDAVKFHEMPKSVQDVMCSIWFYQTLMDSAQNRGLEETIASFITNPEWECLLKTWEYFEMIHSISYSHIIRGIFVDSKEVFEKNFSNESIINRVRGEIESYSNLAELGELEESEDSIRKILEMILIIYALEGIKFYASFLLTYLIHDKFRAIPGASRIIKLINFDEDTHTRASVVLLGQLMDDEAFRSQIQTEWFANKAHEVFSKVLSDEKSFADYLVEQGGMDLPVSRDGVHKFLDYYVDFRLGEIGVPGLTGQEKTDMVEWFDTYKDLNKENIALQESDMAVYNIGVMEDDL